MSSKPLTKTIKVLASVILLLAFLGFLDATYLTVEHFANVIPPCTTTGGCEKVLTSQFAIVFGVPIALVGAVYYFLVLAFFISFFDTGKFFLVSKIWRFTAVGFASSVWFLYLQFFIVKAICPYCMASAVISTAIFVLSIVFDKMISNAKVKEFVA